MRTFGGCWGIDAELMSFRIETELIQCFMPSTGSRRCLLKSLIFQISFVSGTPALVTRTAFNFCIISVVQYFCILLFPTQTEPDRCMKEELLEEKFSGILRLLQEHQDLDLQRLFVCAIELRDFQRARQNRYFSS